MYLCMCVCTYIYMYTNTHIYMHQVKNPSSANCQKTFCTMEMENKQEDITARQN